MRIGVVSDVHGNLPALRTALAALGATGYDRLLCPGDLVGYGPMPNECVELLAEAGAVCVAGNHDLIALGRLSPDRCVPAARRSLAWTAAVLGAQARAFLGELPLREDLGEVVFAHGTLEDTEAPVRTPQAPGVAAALAREHPEARVLVLGHTHEPGAWDAEGRPVPHEGVQALPAGRCIVNPGAVGQTRSRVLHEPRPLARWMVLDLDASTAEWVAAPYPLRPLRRGLRRAGLPRRTYRQAAPLRRALAARL